MKINQLFSCQIHNTITQKMYSIPCTKHRNVKKKNVFVQRISIMPGKISISRKLIAVQIIPNLKVSRYQKLGQMLIRQCSTQDREIMRQSCTSLLNNTLLSFLSRKGVAIICVSIWDFCAVIEMIMFIVRLCSQPNIQLALKC